MGISEYHSVDCREEKCPGIAVSDSANRRKTSHQTDKDATPVTTTQSLPQVLKLYNSYALNTTWKERETDTHSPQLVSWMMMMMMMAQYTSTQIQCKA